MLLLGTARLMRVPGAEQNVCCWQADPGAEHWEGAGGPPPLPSSDGTSSQSSTRGPVWAQHPHVQMARGSLGA